jgi:hypothetical protein
MSIGMSSVAQILGWTRDSHILPSSAQILGWRHPAEFSPDSGLETSCGPFGQVCPRIRDRRGWDNCQLCPRIRDRRGWDNSVPGSGTGVVGTTLSRDPGQARLGQLCPRIRDRRGWDNSVPGSGTGAGQPRGSDKSVPGSGTGAAGPTLSQDPGQAWVMETSCRAQPRFWAGDI